MPVVPRYDGPGRRARARRQGHRRDAVRRRRGHRHRPDHRPDGGARGGRRRRRRRCTTGSRSPSGPCSSRPSAGSPAKASPSPTGRCGSANDREHSPTDTRPHRDQARPGLRLRQGRARGAGPGPARRRRRARLHRRLGEADRRARPAGDQGRGPHRLPRVPRRPGQDAAPEGARRHPRRPPAADPRRGSSRSSGSSRSTSWSPTSTRSPRRWCRVPRPTSASSRSTSAVPRWCGPRRRTTRRSRSSPRPTATTTCSRPLGEGGFTLEQRKRLAAEAFVHTATYDVHVAQLDGQRADRHLRRRRLPGLGGRHLGPRERAALRREPAPAGGALPQRLRAAGLAQAEQLHGKEMSYNNYVDADAARRAAYDFDEPAVAIIKHANPCGIAVGADVAEAHRKAHECDPVSAFGGVIAVNRPVSVEMARQVAEVFTEVVVAPAYDEGAVEVLQGKKNVRLLECEPLARGGVETRPISGGLLMQGATRSTPTGTTRRPGPSPPARPPPTRCSPTSRSRGGPAARRSPTRSCWPATAPRSASAWARSTGSTRAGSRSTAPATGPRVRWPRPTRSSRSRTARRS